jgi:hypothetical protein
MSRNAFDRIVEEMNRDEELAEIAMEERAAVTNRSQATGQFSNTSPGRRVNTGAMDGFRTHDHRNHKPVNKDVTT